MSDRPSPSTRTAKKLGWLRRGFTLGARLALIFAIFAMTAYLTRRVWIEPFVLRQARDYLGDLLEADVQIESIGGNWIDVVVLEGLAITPHRDSAAQIEIAGGRAELAISLRAALRFDWARLTHGARITADLVRVGLPTTSDETPPDEQAPAIEWPADPWELWAKGLAPAGVLLDLNSAELHTKHGTKRGSVHLELAATNASGTHRSLRGVLFDASLSVDVDVRSRTAAFRFDSDRPLDWARVFMDSSSVVVADSGQLNVHAQLCADGRFVFDAHLNGVALEDRGEIEVIATLDRSAAGLWRARDLEFSLPGGHVRAQDVVLDERAVAERDLASLASTLHGEVEITVDDFGRFGDLLPEHLDPWLPSRGSLVGTIEQQSLRVASGRVLWPNFGAELRIAAGHVPLRADAPDGTLDVAITFDESHNIVIDDQTSVSAQGIIRAKLTGSLEALVMDAQLNLGVGAVGATSWRTLRGRATLDAEQTVAFDLAANGIESATHELNSSAIDVEASGRVQLAGLADADVTFEVIEQERGDRTSVVIQGSIAKRGTVVSTEQLRIAGPVFAERITGNYDLDDSTIALTCGAWSLDPQAVGRVLGLELPPHGVVHGALRVGGALTNPACTLSVDAELPNGPAWFGQDAWPADLSAPTSDALVATARIRRDPAATTAIEQLTVTLGETLRLELEGTSPVDWNGTEWVAVTADLATTLTGRLALRLKFRRDAKDAADLIAVGPLTLDPRSMDPASVDDASGDRISIDTAFDWHEDTVTIPSLRLSGSYAKVPQRASGSATLQGFSRAVLGELSFSDIVTTGEFATDSLDLESIPRSVHGLPALAGTLQARVELAGPLALPIRSGRIGLERARIKFAGVLPTIDDLTVIANADEHEIRFERADGLLGGGRFKLTGKVNSRARWFGDGRGDVDLKLSGDNLLLARQTGLKARADVDLTIRGPFDEMTIAGHVQMTSGALVRRISLLPDFRNQGGASGGLTGLDLAIPEPLGSRLRYDLSFATLEPFALQLHVVEAPVSANFHLRGTGSAPILEGIASALSGTVRLPAMSMQISRALIRANPAQPAAPIVSILARGRRLGVDVQAQVEGPLDATKVTFSSTPALSPDDLTILLSTGRLPDDLRERGLESQAAVVGTYLAQELVDFYFGSDSTERDESLAERISFESGREISRNGVESITVEFDLRSGFFLQAERDVYEDYNMGALYRFRF